MDGELGIRSYEDLLTYRTRLEAQATEENPVTVDAYMDLHDLSAEDLAATDAVINGEAHPVEYLFDVQTVLEEEEQLRWDTAEKLGHQLEYAHKVYGEDQDPGIPGSSRRADVVAATAGISTFVGFYLAQLFTGNISLNMDEFTLWGVPIGGAAGAVTGVLQHAVYVDREFDKTRQQLREQRDTSMQQYTTPA